MSETIRIKNIIQEYEKIVTELGRPPLPEEVPGWMREARVDGVPVLVEACPSMTGIVYREVGEGCGPVVPNPVIKR